VLQLCDSFDIETRADEVVAQRAVVLKICGRHGRIGRLPENGGELGGLNVIEQNDPGTRRTNACV